MNANTTQTLEPQAITCISCGTAENVVTRADHHGEDLCGRCSAQRALWDASAETLRVMLEPVIREWTAHWHAAGIAPITLQEICETTLEELNTGH
jgi:hypothetical protein